MAAAAELTPTSYIQHHLQNLTASVGEGGFITRPVDTLVGPVARRVAPRTNQVLRSPLATEPTARSTGSETTPPAPTNHDTYCRSCSMWMVAAITAAATLSTLPV